MTGLRLVARWYLRASRILLARWSWRREKRRRLIAPIGAPIRVASSSQLIVRPIRKLRESEHPCPQCGSWLIINQGVEKGAWKVWCGDCRLHWSIPVQYEEAREAANVSAR